MFCGRGPRGGAESSVYNSIVRNRKSRSWNVTSYRGPFLNVTVGQEKLLLTQVWGHSSNGYWVSESKDPETTSHHTYEVVPPSHVLTTTEASQDTSTSLFHLNYIKMPPKSERGYQVFHPIPSHPQQSFLFSSTRFPTSPGPTAPEREPYQSLSPTCQDWKREDEKKKKKKREGGDTSPCMPKRQSHAFPRPIKNENK